MKKKFLFISKDNLTTNPRLQKELKFAIQLGYDVDFVGFNLGSWSDKIDEEVIKNLNANFHYIDITRNSFFQWFLSSVIEKISKKIYFLFKNNLKISTYAHSKRSFLLLSYLKKNKQNYDLIIAHALPTLYPAYKFAEKLKIPFIFDIEDYHPGEIIPVDKKNEKERRVYLMKNILLKANYITYASPLIGEHSMKLLNSQFAAKNSQLINNCFAQTEFQFKKNNSEKIKFVWFSQNISQGRGLELFVPALERFKDKIELTIIGNLYEEFYNNFLKQYHGFIKIEKPLLQKRLNFKLAEFDVGIASEISMVDLNKKIALANKIFAYVQSGLFVLATDTFAQTKFLEEHKDIGLISEQDNDSFVGSIKKIIENIVEIRNNKQKRFEYAKKMSWENESQKLIDIWEHCIL